MPDIKLLAALSGLSTAYVSNFLRSKSGSISQANADRLAQLVDGVGYVLRGAAQNLRKQRRRVVGIAALLSNISPGVYLEIISGAKCETTLLGFRQISFDVTTVLPLPRIAIL